MPIRKLSAIITLGSVFRGARTSAASTNSVPLPIRPYDTDNRGDETLDQQISNNSLLLDMLGAGSEEKIRTLTPAARANLIEGSASARDVSAVQ